MEVIPIEKLRRSVRTAVHRARRRRDDVDGLDGVDVAEILSLADGVASDEMVRQWVMDDESDFERAVLISEMVAARLRHAPGLREVSPEPPASSRPSQPELVRAAARSGPRDIADLLDEMLVQQAPKPAARM
jgi:hypothetical protein